MKKRLASILLALVMIFSLLPTAAFAAGGDYEIDITATKFSTVQYNGKDTMKLDFMLKTNNGAQVRGIQTALISVDLEKYDILQYVGGSVYNRTATVATGSTVLKSYAYSTYYDAVNDIGITAKNAFKSSGTDILLTFEADFGANDVSLNEKTSLMSILLGLKDGVEWNELTSDSVRLATSSEASSFNATGVVTIGGTQGDSYVYLPANGSSDTLTSAPELAPDNSFEFVKGAYSGAAATISNVAKVDDNVVVTASVPGGETAQYGYSTTNDASAVSNWQDSNTFAAPAAGTYYFFARVKENGAHQAGGVSDGTSFTVYGPLSLSYTAPASMTIGTAIDDMAPTVGGGSGGYTYAVTSGSLPAGLSLNEATGVISGTPTAASGAASVTVTVTDSASSTKEVVINFPAVEKKTNTVTFTSPKSEFVEGQNVSFTATATSGSPSYTYQKSGEDSWNGVAPTAVGSYKVKATVAESEQYKEGSAIHEFSIVAKAVTSISVTAPTKTTYVVGQSLDTTGMVITAYYNDETNAPVAIGDANIAGFDSSAPAASQTITVIYCGGSDTFTVTIEAKTLQSLAITTNPDKTSGYKAFETLDTTGMVVTATYNSGAEVVSAGQYTISYVNGDSFRAGDTKAIVNFGGMTADVTVSAVDKATLDVSGVSWTGADSVPYDGQAHSVTLTGLPAGLAVTGYTDNEKTYVGSYTAKATLSYDSTNYALSGAVADKAWSITAVNQTPAITATANVTKGGNTLDLKTLVSNAEGTVSFEISGNANGCSISNGILTSGADTGTVKITVNITAKDMNSDSTAEYNAYTGTEAITVTIVDKQSASLTVTQTGCTYGETLADPTYNEPAGTTSTVITYNGTVLKDSSSYSSTTAPTEAGTYTVNVKCETATHIYEGTSASFTIAPKSISGMTVTLSATELEYTGSEQTITATIVGLEASDYNVSGILSATNAGNYTVTVTGKDNYTGTANASWRIAPKSISGMTVTLSADTKEYNGESQSVSVSSVGTLNASDYDVSGAVSGTNVGDYTVTVTGKGNYTGTANATWKINPKSVTSAMIASVDSQPYTGNAITPKPAVTDGSALVENTDFTYGYEANTYVGTATVKIIGKGNYTGTASKTFQITPVSQTPAITATANVTKGGNTLDLKSLVSNVQGSVSFEISGSDNGCSISNGILTSGADTGTVKITVNITAKDMNSDSTAEYNAYTGTEAITVTIMNKQSASLSVSQTGCTYGDALEDPTYTKPDGTTNTTITYNGTLAKGGTYSDTTAPTEAGTYTVNVKCETATHIYEGTSASFTIAPKSISGMTVNLSATTKEYNDSTQSVTVTGVTGLTASDYDVSGSLSGTNVGDYTVTVTGKGNYTGTANAIWKITPKAITISNATATNRSYVKDDKSVVISGVTFAGASLIKDTDYTVTGVMDDANAGTGKTVNVTVVLNNSNYSLATATTATTVDIAKASAQTLADIVDSFKYTVTSGDKAIGTAGMPADAGALEYVKGTESKTGSVTVSSWAVDTNGKVTYALSGGAENDTITLPITIQSTNYADSVVNVKLTLTAKAGQATLNIASGTTVVYGGTLNLAVSGGSGSGAVTYTVTNGTGEATVNGNVLTATKAGEVTVIATKADDNDYNAVDSAPVTITISKATPTGTPGYTKITASGKTLGDAALTVGTINPAGGTIVWDLGDAQTVSANTSYSWTYTPADTTNYNVLTGSIKPYVVSSGGGGGYVSTYAITVADAKNGDVTANTKSAVKGETITLTVAPDKGYTLETLTVTDKNGKEIELTNKGDGKYTFKMPASKVTVKATFMDDNTMLNFFVDVPADAYYYDAVLWAVKEGITNGTSVTTFSPDNPCTRAQMATFLWRAAGSPEPVSKACIFTDVPADAYYVKAVQWAYEQGITAGTSATTYSPDEACTRGQMATFLCRMADGKPVNDTVIFADIKADKYYAKAVQWAYEQKITVGTSATTFSPDDPCTRAQMVTFLYRYFVK